MSLCIPFDNTYARLPETLFSAQPPTPVAAPRLIAFNKALAAELGISADIPEDEIAAALSGNAVPDGATPIAQAYAGHQFGNWNPGLGDGRAVLLGEVAGRNGRRDIQLKGAGPTPYSRNGDGRAWLGPVLREYLVSEAMHAMGVPTTRALAAVATGEAVFREQGALPGAILTRVAASHIRVGTFQLFAARRDMTALEALFEHTRARHYPEAEGVTDVLAAVSARQARLIAQWAGLGFVHGVMNTDNMAISGETIDYGPCAFIDGYHPDTVFSSIDQRGRYAYSNQPRIAVWNLAQFATALIPLMPDKDAAIEDFTTVINGFAEVYETEWAHVFATKLGLSPGPVATDLAERLLSLMATEAADFTNLFAALGGGSARDHVMDRVAFAAWERDWRAAGPDLAAMAQVNPRIIPRTHLIEAAIQSAVAGDFAPFHTMLAAVTAPYAPLDDARAPYARAPLDHERVLRTFCGT